MSAVLKPAPEFEAMLDRDLDEVLEIERRVYEFPWTLLNFADSIRVGYHCAVYRSSERMLGYAVLMLAAGEAHLLNLTIDAPFQRRGHGSQFLHYLLDAARIYRAATMLLEVRPSNTPAIELYLRHGFHQIGVRREYYPGSSGREDALVLERRL